MKIAQPSKSQRYGVRKQEKEKYSDPILQTKYEELKREEEEGDETTSQVAESDAPRESKNAVRQASYEEARK